MRTFVVGDIHGMAGPLERLLERLRGMAVAGDRLRDDIGAEVAGATYPYIEALSKVAMQTTVEEDFNSGLRMLLDGIATRRPRKRR